MPYPFSRGAFILIQSESEAMGIDDALQALLSLTPKLLAVAPGRSERGSPVLGELTFDRGTEREVGSDPLT